MNDRWPFPDQRGNPLARARHVAAMYQAVLRATDARVAADMDTLISGYGETWILGRVIVHEEDDLLSSTEAAEYLGVSVGAVRQYRLRERLRGIKTPDGWRYRFGDLRIFHPADPGRKKAPAK